MKKDYRGMARWQASSNKHQVRILAEDGGWLAATLIDISKSGIGLRANRHRFKPGTRTSVKVDLSGEIIEVKGEVRFVDQYYPRIGLQIESTELMEIALQHVESGGFAMAEVRGDTLFVKGSVMLASGNAFNAARGFRKLDLSGVSEISYGGAHHVLQLTQQGVKIACCSASIAPRFDSLGICQGARLCVAKTPCDLPKTWPLSLEFLARLNRADSPD